MSKVTKIFILLIVVVLVFNNQIIAYSLKYGFSKWIERKIILDKFQINFIQRSIIIKGLKIKNSNKFYYDNIFESEKISLNYNLQSLFTNLIVINNLTIENAKFFFELIEKSPNIYDDNIGVAVKKIENTPKKVWPEKNKDTNFLILKTKIKGAKTFIKTSFFSHIFDYNIIFVVF